MSLLRLHFAEVPEVLPVVEEELAEDRLFSAKSIGKARSENPRDSKKRGDLQKERRSRWETSLFFRSVFVWSFDQCILVQYQKCDTFDPSNFRKLSCLKNAAEVMHAAQSSYFQDTEIIARGLVCRIGRVACWKKFAGVFLSCLAFLHCGCKPHPQLQLDSSQFIFVANTMWTPTSSPLTKSQKLTE